MTNLLDRTEAEAAALEALQPVDDNTTLLAAIADARKLKAQRDAAAAAYTAAADKLGAYLTEEGLQGLTLHGKVVVRRSLVRTARLDSKKLKEKHPRIYAAFTSVTESVRLKVD